MIFRDSVVQSPSLRIYVGDFRIEDEKRLIREENILLLIYKEMVKIRLRREGSKGRPYYRIVVADQRTRREGAYIDTVGTYDPLKEENGAKVDLEKVDDWISKGAQPSDTVRSLIKKARQASA